MHTALSLFLLFIVLLSLLSLCFFAVDAVIGGLFILGAGLRFIGERCQFGWDLIRCSKIRFSIGIVK